MAAVDPKQVPTTAPAQPSRLRKFDYCVSGRLKSEVHAEITRLQREHLRIDQDLHKQRVAICKKNWKEKYGTVDEFHPEAAYTSLIPGEQLDQELCQEFYDLTNAICALNEELAEKPE